jgi:prophage antirepressor-like protein
MADVYDEIETLALAPLATKSAAAAKSIRTESKVNPEPEKTTCINSLTPLVALFQAILIRIFGTVDDPLFCALDVATYIDDAAHYARIVSKYIAGEQVQRHKMADKTGRMQLSYFLTEAGVYRYLMQAKGEKAAEFQQYVYKLLKEERKRTVDSLQLALKITQTKLEETKRREASIYRVANDAREKNAELTKEVAKLRKEKHAAANADFLRSMGRGHLVEESSGAEDEGDEGDE